MNENDQLQAHPDHTTRPFRGRFMDMVHPSSDVKVADKANFASNRQSDKSEESEPTEKANNIFEPVAFSNSTKPEIYDTEETEPKDAVSNQPELLESASDDKELDQAKDEPLKSPFLPGIKVDKRPLGNAETTMSSVMPDWLQRELDDLSEPELPADDGGSGNMELELPAKVSSKTESEEPKLEPVSPVVVELSPSRSIDTRAALENTMIQPQYKANTSNGLDRPSSPYAYASQDDNTTTAKVKKHIPVWTWIIIYILLILVGGAVGALIYLSGWLG